MKETITAWQRVLNARDEQRPKAQIFINNVFEGFVELHGDRTSGDDPSIIGGLAYLNGIPVTVVAQEKGSDLKSRLKRNYGMPHPSGYKKALRLMKQAEKFNRPVITIVDTPGAFPGIEAEKQGQANAIAENLAAMMTLKTPIISVVIGEGGSGGALAISVADKILMMENAIYSVISPEGFATILYKNTQKPSDIVDYIKLTANDLKQLNLIDRIIQENQKEIDFRGLNNALYDEIQDLLNIDKQDLLDSRYNRFKYI